MKNKMTDLNNHLFAQIERISEEGLSAEQIEIEVRRAGAIVEVADKIIQNAALQLKAVTLVAEYGEIAARRLTMLDDGKPNPAQITKAPETAR